MSLVRARANAGAYKNASHKLRPEAIDLIIEMAANGESSAAIRIAIQDGWGIKVHPNLICYYRRTRAMRIAELSEAAIVEARARSRFASLADRVGTLEGIVQRELAEPDRGSARTLAVLIGEIDEMMYRAESVYIRSREIQYEMDRSDDHERIIQELERRSHVE